MDAQEAYLQSREENREVELGDGEIDTMISIPLPVWTTPSHAVHPVFVTHKIKWSCVISNPDGHSESKAFFLDLVSRSSSEADLVLPSRPNFSFRASMRSSHPRPRCSSRRGSSHRLS